jgi:hypothetical protein
MRCAAALLFLGGGLCFAQSSGLPATSPTSDGAPTAVTASKPSAGEPAIERAVVVYSENTLEVTANNSSLNQILRDIARETGMKITGGVIEEGVYGTYGPAPAAQVLASLLQGTGSNMMLKVTLQGAPAELILTPRGGGPTPPSPNAGGFYNDPHPMPAQTFSPQAPGPAMGSTLLTPQSPRPGGMVVQPTVPAAPVRGASSGFIAQPTGGSDAASPNGVKTPQQIYEQLQQLRQQQPPAQP